MKIYAIYIGVAWKWIGFIAWDGPITEMPFSRNDYLAIETCRESGYGSEPQFELSRRGIKQ